MRPRERLGILSLVIPVFWSCSASAQLHHIPSEFDSKLGIRVHDVAADSFCDGGSPSHAGWVDIDIDHLFYWYQEARKDTPDTPVIVWVQGSPGESSMIASVLENGDCIVDGENFEFQRNPNSWTEAAHVIFLEQTVDLGFSYRDDEQVEEQQTGFEVQLIKALKQIYVAFPHLASREVHIAGEGLGGRLFFKLARSILQYNDYLPPGIRSSHQINLGSVIIGNGLIYGPRQLGGLYETGCTAQYGIEPIFNSSLCAGPLADQAFKCEMGQQDCLSVSPDSNQALCAAAGKECLLGLYGAASLVERDEFDRTQSTAGCKYPDCLTPPLDALNATVFAESFASKLLGEEARRYRNDIMFTETLFEQTAGSSLSDLRHLLEDDDIRVLLYYGARDWMASPGPASSSLDEGLGGKIGLQWRSSPVRDTSSLGWQGSWRDVLGKLCFVEFKDAGRLVPRDESEGMLNLLKEWVIYRKGSKYGLYQQGIMLNQV